MRDKEFMTGTANGLLNAVLWYTVTASVFDFVEAMNTNSWMSVCSAFHRLRWQLQVPLFQVIQDLPSSKTRICVYIYIYIYSMSESVFAVWLTSSQSTWPTFNVLVHSIDDQWRASIPPNFSGTWTQHAIYHHEMVLCGGCFSENFTNHSGNMLSTIVKRFCEEVVFSEVSQIIAARSHVLPHCFRVE